MQSRPAFTPLLRPVLAAVADVLICLRFYSRLPIPSFAIESERWDSGTLDHDQTEDYVAREPVPTFRHHARDPIEREHNVARKTVPTFRHHALDPIEREHDVARKTVPTFRHHALGRALRAAPVAGLVIGAVAALVLAVGIEALGLPSFVAATLALGAQILLSGALHEDGLADVADGFGGGSDLRRKLDIMRDSRVGTYGALALILSTALRIGILVALLDRYGLGAAAAALPAAGALSRGFGLFPLAILPPARTDGMAHSAGRLPPSSVGCATGIAMFLGITLAVMGGLSEARGLAACAAAGLASLAVTRLARRQIGGQTGDVAGAAQQCAEMAYLLTLLVFRF